MDTEIDWENICECGLDKGSCVWCTYPDHEVVDMWCPNCSEVPEGSGSTWHIILSETKVMCCKCKTYHSPTKGLL